MRALITGGAGFIGHHLVEHLLKETDWHLVILDKLDHSGSLNRLAEVLSQKTSWLKRVTWVYHDLRAPISLSTALKIGTAPVVFHLAAGSSVDRSIVCPSEFVQDNVVGTCNLLEWARMHGPSWLQHFIYFSTDEVFGPATSGQAFQEWDRYNSANPYAATKAGAEELCLAYANTYKMPISITHCMNVIGERQHPEKFVPLVINAVLQGRKVLIHADETKTHPGSRFYIHARNVASAVLFIHEQVTASGSFRGKYNIVGEKEVDNRQLAQMIAEICGVPLEYELVDFHSSRPGHDLRYALDGSWLKQMGWAPPRTLEQSLEKTVQWCLQHPEWMKG